MYLKVVSDQLLSTVLKTVCPCEYKHKVTFDRKVEDRYIFFVVVMNQQSAATSVMRWQGGELHPLKQNVTMM